MVFTVGKWTFDLQNAKSEQPKLMASSGDIQITLRDISYLRKKDGAFPEEVSRIFGDILENRDLLHWIKTRIYKVSEVFEAKYRENNWYITLLPIGIPSWVDHLLHEGKHLEKPYGEEEEANDAIIKLLAKIAQEYITNYS